MLVLVINGNVNIGEYFMQVIGVHLSVLKTDLDLDSISMENIPF